MINFFSFLRESWNKLHTYTHIKNWGQCDFLARGNEVKFHSYIPSKWCLKEKKKKSCYCQHISPTLVGHFHVFIFRVLRVIVSRQLLENSSFPYSTFLHFPISRSVDKHWDRDIILEYSFWQAKKFPHYKQDGLTRIQLAEGKMRFWTFVLHSVNWPFYKVLKEGKGYF